MDADTHTDRTLQPGGGWTACSLTDTEIIARVLAGNSAAYEGIMRRYNRLLFRLARGIAGNDEDAVDIVQESYVRAYYRLSQFKGPDGFPSWISRIVVNEAISRTRKRRVETDGVLDPDATPANALDRPEEIVMGYDTLEIIESAIDRLPPDFRIVFMLRGVEELSVNETAELLNIKPATVKTRFHRARNLMRKALDRRIRNAVPSTFGFDGRRCDSIVDTVFANIAGIQNERH